MGFFSNHILVIGAVHIDILGDYPAGNSDHIDRPGNITYSVGGTAYNIASMLAKDGKNVQLCSLLKEDSLLTDLIQAKIKENGIGQKYIQRTLDVAESGFLGHRIHERRDLMSAVSACAVGLNGNWMSEGRLLKAIKRSKLVIVDCNLTPEFLSGVVRICASQQRSLLVAGVSEAKAVRALHVQVSGDQEFAFVVFVSNAVEFLDILLNTNIVSENDERVAPIIKNLNKKSLSRIEAAQKIISLIHDDSELSAKFCSTLRSRYILVSDSQEWRLFSCDGELVLSDSPDLGVVRSYTGAGDATLAAVGAFISERDGKFNFSSDNVVLKNKIEGFLRICTDHNGASPNSELTWPGHTWLRRTWIRSHFGNWFWPLRIFAVGMSMVVGALISLAVAENYNPAFCWLKETVPFTTPCKPDTGAEIKRNDMMKTPTKLPSG